MVMTGASPPRSLRPRISPSRSTNINLAGVPSCIITSPGSKRNSCVRSTNQSRSGSGRSEKTATLRSAAKIVALSDGWLGAFNVPYRSAVSSGISVIRLSLSCRDCQRWTAKNASLYLGQVLVHELYDHGAFANAGRYSLDGAMTDVTNHENTRHAGFQ